MKSNKKKVIVTRKWLLDFADTIYNPKTKIFLNLCRGKLTNGPDPKNTKRTMHCGLGELYFQLMGKHPVGLNIDETTVVNKTIEHSSLFSLVIAENELLNKAVSKLKTPQVYDFRDSLESLKYAIKNFDPWEDERIENLGNILSNIPHENDLPNFTEDSMTAYRKRSMRVAAILRNAAKLLP